LQSGDTPYTWRTEPFQMFIDGEYWLPPDLVPEDDEEALSDPDEEEARLASRGKGYLGLSGQRKFLWLLRGVDGRRGSVARGMAYAMDRADAAEEVCTSLAFIDDRLWISSSRVYVRTIHPSQKRLHDYISSVIFCIIHLGVVVMFGNTVNCTSSW